MSWRDSLLPASFRGVAFAVESAERSGGRRLVRHEFPNSEDAPSHEDMGRKGGVFPVTGFLVGDDYPQRMNALLAALNTEGAGELVHPYFGTLRVVCGSFRFENSAREGRMVRLSAEFEETAELVQPAALPDTVGELTSAAATAKTSATSEFLAKFDELSNLRDSVTGALEAASDAVGVVLSTAQIAGQTLSELTAQVADLTADAESLFDTPSVLASTLLDLVEALGDGLLLVTDSLNPLAPLLALYSADLGERPPGDTAARLVEQVNFDATSNLWKRAVLAQASLMAIEQTFDSYEQAVTVREAVTALLDAHCEDTADDVYPALQGLRASLTRAVPGEDGDLPHLVTVTPHDTVPSLVLAHRLYGNVTLEGDLVARNRIANPSFVTGGVALEVLSDE